jgi:sec-independent protein translocase protein TatA
MLVFGTKKLRNIGSDLGGAVKGFKEGMKDGGDAAASSESGVQKVAENDPTKTIDVVAKEKSSH